MIKMAFFVYIDHKLNLAIFMIFTVAPFYFRSVSIQKLHKQLEVDISSIGNMLCSFAESKTLKDKSGGPAFLLDSTLI